MRYEDRIVDEVQAANDIVEIIGQYLPLKRAGRNFKGLCPFHQEKTPSFMVNPEKQIFHCFGCSAGGDVFSFLMRHENSSFPEVLRQLAERAHIRLPERESSRDDEAGKEKEQIYEAYRLAADYYHAEFLHPVRGKPAREYFIQKRGFSEELAREFKIGWAPEAWRGLLEFLTKKGFSEQLLVKARLVNRSTQGHFYDIFRGRLLFPIQNLRGKEMAFGGRLIADAEGPKYLNSPEHPAFSKRKELFGLNVAKKFIDRDLPQLLVVEGYMDFLRLYQKGFKTAVATLGTSLTGDHVQVLKRFADEAVVVYDGDRAGQEASLRGLEIFLEGGMNVKLVRLPAGEDPDDVLQKRGADFFRDSLKGAKDFFDFKLEHMLDRFDRSNSLGLMKITGEFLETFSKIRNPVLTDRYLRRLAGSLGIGENSLRDELAKLKKKTEVKKAGPKPAAVEPPASEPVSQDELLLLTLMIDDAGFRETGLKELDEGNFSGARAREAFRLLVQMDETGREITWPQVLNRLDDDEFKKKLVAGVSLAWTDEDKQKAVEDCLKGIKRKKVERRLEELRRQIAAAERGDDQAGLAALVKEYQGLLQQVSR